METKLQPIVHVNKINQLAVKTNKKNLHERIVLTAFN